MPRLAIRTAAWILTLLCRLAVTENKTYPEQNVSLLDSQEDRLAHDSTGSFWKQIPLCGNESIKTAEAGASNETSRFDRPAKDTDLEGEYKNISINGKTLTDYNGPVIMEDLDNTNDQDLTSHVRVKRAVPIVRDQLDRSVNSIDSLPRSSWQRTDVTNVFGDSTFKGLHSDHKYRSGTPGITGDTIASRSRPKRGVLSKNGRHKKRVKGNAKHSQHHVETRNGNRKHGVLKSFHQPVMRKTNSPSSRKKSKNIRETGMPDRMIDESQMESRIEKRESGNSNLNANIVKADTADHEKTALINQKGAAASLINNRSLDEQRKENTVVLPFVDTGKAQLRVRIEKIPTNESSFVSSNRWTDRSAGTSPCSIMLPKYGTSDEILDVNVTNLEIAPNLDFAGKKEAKNLTVKITLRKLNHGSNASGRETSDSESTSFDDAESQPVGSIVPVIEDSRNTENRKYDRTNAMSAGSSDDDAKSRAKRNQEITSRRYLRSDKNAKGSKRFKDVEHGASIGSIKYEKARYRTRGNRAVRSIEEIKGLAEKLIVKINELQVFVSNHNETLHARGSCSDKNADRAVIEEEPRISPKEKDTPSFTSRIAEGRQRFAKEAALAGKRASQARSSGSRFAREEYRTRRRLRRKWGRWMDWSSCSVTCGKGRQIRWRHCLHECDDAETEMEEKACQLPACPPSKFLGIF